VLSGGDDFRFFDSSRAEEETQVPRAALAATKWAQKQGKEDRPFQNASPVGTQHILAAAQGALTRSNR